MLDERTIAPEPTADLHRRQTQMTRCLQQERNRSQFLLSTIQDHEKLIESHLEAREEARGEARRAKQALRLMQADVQQMQGLVTEADSFTEGLQTQKLQLGKTMSMLREAEKRLAGAVRAKDGLKNEVNQLQERLNLARDEVRLALEKQNSAEE